MNLLISISRFLKLSFIFSMLFSLFSNLISSDLCALLVFLFSRCLFNLPIQCLILKALCLISVSSVWCFKKSKLHRSFFYIMSFFPLLILQFLPNGLTLWVFLGSTPAHCCGVWIADSSSGQGSQEETFYFYEHSE